MEETTITLKTALIAKELGFDAKVRFHYKGNELIFNGALYNFNNKDEQSLWNVEITSCPTQSLLQKWLREVKDENIVPPLYFKWQGYACDIMGFENTEYFPTYEDALENKLVQCLRRLSEAVC